MTNSANKRNGWEVLIAGTVAGIFLLLMLVVLCALKFEQACCAIYPDPCPQENRGHRVIADGLFVGCTSDPTNFRG